MKLTQKGRLKKRISAYRTLGLNWVYLMETDFKGVFANMMIEKDIETINQGFGVALDKLIEVCSEEECLKLNQRLDCYQLDKKCEIR